MKMLETDASHWLVPSDRIRYKDHILKYREFYSSIWKVLFCYGENRQTLAQVNCRSWQDERAWVGQHGEGKDLSRPGGCSLPEPEGNLKKEGGRGTRDMGRCDRTREYDVNGDGRYSSDARNKFFTQRVMKHWDSCGCGCAIPRNVSTWF